MAIYPPVENFTEFVLCLFILLQWTFFALGAHQLSARVWAPKVWGEGPLLILGLVGLTLALGPLMARPLWLFRLFVVGVQCTGFAAFVLHPPQRAFFRRHFFIFVLTTVNFGFWFWLLADLDGLPSFHDGIAHTAYYLRMVENGQPLLHLNAVGLQDLFGPGRLRFYPGGTHALVAIFDGWIPNSYATPSQILKAWLLLLTAGVPILAYGLARALAPGRSLWVYATVAMAAFTYYRFPVWQVPSGGFSRHCALFVLFPLVAECVRATPPRLLLRLLWLVGPVSAFLLHPGGFGLLVLTLVWVAVCDPKSRNFVDGVCAALGVGAVLWLVKATGSDAHFTSVIPGVAGASVYGQARTLVLLIPSIFDDFSNAAVAPLSARELLVYVAIFACFKVGGRALLPPRVWRYPWFLFAGLAAMLACALLPWTFAQLIPQLFYNHPDRTAEVYYVAQVIVWCLGALYLYENRRRRTAQVFIVLVFVLGAVDTAKSLRFFTRHVPEYMATYQSPLRSTSGDTIKYLRALTEPNAVVVADPYVLDSIESRSLRHSLFLYSECPAGSVGENCDNRQAFHAHLRAAVGNRWQHPSLDSCLGFVRPMGRPFYWLVKRQGAAESPCEDLRRIATLNGYDLYRVF